MQLHRLFLRLALASSALWSISPAGAQNESTGPTRDAVARLFRGEARRPRLTVVISIDQCRADLLTRLADLFLPAEVGGRLGGFRYLMTRGACFTDAQYEHLPLFTGPGHAVIMTGGYPYKTGIISNDWWDTKDRRSVYCVDDPRWKVVGAADGSKARPMGPALLKSSTVGDELKLATAGHAKVVTLGIKDRAAILLGGHAQDASIWFDTTGGRWISSTAFCRDGALPAWVEEVNKQHIPDRMLGADWTPRLAQNVLQSRSFPPGYIGQDIPAGFGASFPHKVGAEPTPSHYKAFIHTPAANAYVFATAEAAVKGEGLGQDDIPDILAINLATNDYVGHAFGPYAPEVLDLTVQTDAQLSEFLNNLAAAVPGGMDSIVVVLTADHGVSPVPESAAAAPFDLAAGRFSVPDILSAISSGLTARFGEPAGGTWYSQSAGFPEISGAFLDGFIYLNPDAVRQAVAAGPARTSRDVEDAACDAVNSAALPGVYRCYGKMQILEGRIAANDIAAHLARAVYPSISSDLIVLPEQMYLQSPMPDDHATSHGTPYAYDAHVPLLLCAPGLVRPGIYTDPVSPADIAPTLSLLLGIELPSGCDGRPLSAALRP